VIFDGAPLPFTVHVRHCTPLHHRGDYSHAGLILTMRPGPF
jgi:hypothetical protein